ncbi:MAG: plasmid maintenance system killer protein [Erysipelotrichaceae bacterium]|nr:plasmid maintenance system killer protein [Erysipelotrichaceae bacterium]
MNVIFVDDELDRLEIDVNYTGGRSAAIVKAFRNRMQAIRAASDERVFYAMRSFRFEKLKGKRKHQHSMRLNDQYRLVVEIVKNNSRGNVIKIVSIEDYH